MRTRHLSKTARAENAFTLPEVLTATVVIGFMFFTLYAGISAGFAVVQLARENLRGTQILQEKLETIRLYNWDQVTNSTFIPSTFVESFYPENASASGISYTGTVKVAASSISESYSSYLREVTVTVNWVSSSVLRSREMTTYVSRYGLQNYVY
jgi:hypothetical protein